MNQSFQSGGAAGVTPAARPDPVDPPQKLPPPLATRRDIEALAAALGKGETAVARRRDLAELLRRTIVALDERGAGAEAARSARFDRLEQRIDSVEGALRIELAPMIGRILSEELASRLPAPAPRRGIGLMLAFLAGMAALSFYHVTYSYFNIDASTEISTPSGKISVRPLPNGGSAIEGNAVN